MRCVSEVRPVIETCKGFIASLETVWPPFFGTTQNGSLSSVHPINSAYSSKISDKYPKKPSTTFASPIHHILIQFSSYSHPILQFPFSFQMFPSDKDHGVWAHERLRPWTPSSRRGIPSEKRGSMAAFWGFPMVSMGDPQNVWFTMENP